MEESALLCDRSQQTHTICIKYECLSINVWFYGQDTTHRIFVVLNELNCMQIKRLNAFSGVDARNFNLSSIQLWKNVFVT